MMGPSVEQVDAAVRAVLAGLRGPSEPPSGGRGVFPGRLLALRHAEELARGGRVVHVAPGTVVTPLARDHLKRLGVEVRLLSAGLVAAAGDAGEWGLAAESSQAAVGPLRRALLAGPEVWYDLGDARGAVGWLAGSKSRGAVLLSDQSALACWRANQVEGLRAAAAHDADGALRAASTLGANLLVVEPAGRTIFELKHLFHAYRRAGAPRPPAGLVGGDDDAPRRGDRPGHALAVPPLVAGRPTGDRPALAGAGDPGRLAGAWRGGDRV